MEKQLNALDKDLWEPGFEVLDNAKQMQIEKIKTLLIKKVQCSAVNWKNISFRMNF